MYKMATAAAILTLENVIICGAPTARRLSGVEMRQRRLQPFAPCLLELELELLCYWTDLDR